MNTDQRTSKIKDLITELTGSLKMSVCKAIEIGGLLIDQKKEIGHGFFIPWLEDNFELSERTARNYMNLYYHKDKTASLADLNEAYKQIEYIEKQEKEKEQQRINTLIFHRKQTGKIPKEWDHKCDYQWKKWADDEAYNERLKKHIEEKEKKTGTPTKDWETMKEEITALNQLTEVVLKREKERKEWKEKIRISHTGKDDSFLDAVMDYLDTLEDDNRRIEACTNIIKICRNISQQLQQIK